MIVERKQYPSDHWLMSRDADGALAAYLDQQSKAYSRIKNAFVRELAGDLRGARVLDYGCGGGMFTVHAACAGASEVWGVDAEPTVLETAHHFARSRGVESVCRFVASARFPELPESVRFDLIVMKDVLEHVADDVELLVAASYALVPGGRLVVSTQNCLSLNYVLEGCYERAIRRNRDWCGWDPTHVRFYTPMNMQRKLCKAGFTADKWRSVYLIPYKIPLPKSSRKQFLRLDALGWVDRLLGRVFPYNRLGWNVLVSARLKRVAPGVPGRRDMLRK
ncbi:MAG: class I SAM-dependent methyltransferase [Thermodesulfobacteriota bacterium]